MYFDKSIKWKNIYRRNNKSKSKKHLLCFPDHLHGTHRVYYYIIQ